MLHEGAEVFSSLEVPDEVIVVDQEGDDPGDEVVSRAVVVEAVPEDLFRVLRSEIVETITDFGGNEVNGVVALAVGTLAWSLKRPRRCVGGG